MFLFFFGGGGGYCIIDIISACFIFAVMVEEKLGKIKHYKRFRIYRIWMILLPYIVFVQFFYFEYWFIFPSQGFLIFLGQLFTSPHLRKLLNTKYNKHYKCSVLLFIHSYSFFGVKIDISRISDNDYMFRFVHIFY